MARKLVSFGLLKGAKNNFVVEVRGRLKIFLWVVQRSGENFNC